MRTYGGQFYYFQLGFGRLIKSYHRSSHAVIARRVLIADDAKLPSLSKFDP